MKRIGFHSVLMVVSVVSGLCCGFASHSVSLGLYSCAAALIFIPTAKEPAGRALIWSAGNALLLFILSCLELKPLVIVSGSAVILAFLLIYTFLRYSSADGLFQHDAVISSMEIHVRMIYALILQFYGMDMVLWNSVPVLDVILSVCLMGLYVAMMTRIHTGKIMLVAVHVERLVRDGMPGRRGYPEYCLRKEDERNRIDEMASDILAYFEREKPYLRMDYSLNDMIKDMGSNRNYISRTINFKFGCNFSQFVNRSRVEHAIHLLETKPMLKKSEIAARSGFGNVVSFNMAFKMFKGMTPGEYLDEFLSRKRAGEQ